MEGGEGGATPPPPPHTNHGGRPNRAFGVVDRPSKTIRASIHTAQIKSLDNETLCCLVFIAIRWSFSLMIPGKVRKSLAIFSGLTLKKVKILSDRRYSSYAYLRILKFVSFPKKIILCALYQASTKNGPKKQGQKLNYPGPRSLETTFLQITLIK